MTDPGVELRPRSALRTGLRISVAVCGAGVLTMLVEALVSAEDRAGTALAAGLLGLVGVAAPLWVLRVMARSRVRVTGDAVVRVVGGREVARLRFADAEAIRVTWQATPGVLSRRPVVAVLGPAGDGVRGIVAHGVLYAGLDPLLDRVAAEVARRPEVLTSDRAAYDAVMAARPID